MEETPIFRAPKRRRVTIKSTEGGEARDVEVENDSAIVIKRQGGAKRPGTKFSSSTAIVHEDTSDQRLELEHVAKQDEQSSGGLQSRFIGAGSSTQVTNTDRYMYVIQLVS